MKASAGTVQIKVSNGRLQLVFTYQGKRKYISAYRSDDQRNRDLCDTVAAIIRNDQNSGHFDSSLKKYKVMFSGEASSLEKSSGQDITIRTLWDKYTIYKRPNCHRRHLQ
jgi:integrase